VIDVEATPKEAWAIGPEKKALVAVDAMMLGGAKCSVWVIWQQALATSARR